MPETGWLDPLKLFGLRRALLQGELVEAEQLWNQALSTLRPIGPEGRQQLAAALEASASLQEAMGHLDQAQRLRQRAASARKDPHSLQRKQRSGDMQKVQVDDKRRLHLFSDEDEGAKQQRVEAVKRELEAQLHQQEKRRRALKVGALGIAGLATGGVVGLPVAGGALGAGIGWMWSLQR